MALPFLWWPDACLSPPRGLHRQYGYTALMAAAANGHTDAMTLLLDRGADADKQDKASLAPLPLPCTVRYTQGPRLACMHEWL